MIREQAGILLIDDHPKMCRSISLALDDRYAVSQAGDDQEAEYYLQLYPFDLLLIDHRLVGSQKNGLQLVEEFRMRFPHLPSILITAYQTENLIEECIHKEIPLIPMPSDDRFRERVEECLRRFRVGEVPAEPYLPKPWCPKEHPELFEQLYRDSYPDAMKWMMRRVRNQDIAEELVQKAFLYHWKKTYLQFSSHQEFMKYLYTT